MSEANFAGPTRAHEMRVEPMTFTQKLILQIIEENEGNCEWNIIYPKVFAYYKSHHHEAPSKKQVAHEAFLLSKEDAVERTIETPVGVFYRITPWGHALLNPWYKKWIYFFLYKKHNLIAFIALILSFVSLLLDLV